MAAVWVHNLVGRTCVFFRSSVANPAILLFATLVLPTVSAAQLIDTKDATNTSFRPVTSAQLRATDSAAATNPEDDCFIGHFHGFVKQRHPEKLGLEIVSADTNFANETTEITATVRIKNEGHWPVLLPWKTDPVVPANTGGPNDEVTSEQASLRLSLGTQEHRAHGAPLEGNVQFEAVPRSLEQHVRLLQGQWVEVRFKALAQCWLNAADPPLCSEFKTDEHARLTAHYFESLSTSRGEGCKAVSLWKVARRMKSDPIEIDFVAANPLGSAKDDNGVSHQESER
jgi:hypothetical protein